MVYLLLVVLDDLKYLSPVLEAWREIGVPGVTILQSAGAHRVHTWLSEVGLGAIDHLFETRELRRRTLLAALDNEDLLQRAIAETERLVGGFDQPHTGILLVLPVHRASGLHKVKRKAEAQEPEAPPPLDRSRFPCRHMTAKELVSISEVQPTTVRPQDPMDEVARRMLANPEAHVACVVAEDGRLIGLLDLAQVADYLFLHILPEEFLSEIDDLADVAQYADWSRVRTAADAMQEPVWVKKDETLKEAFQRMHKHRLTGLPVVDDAYQVVGYINLIDLLTVCSASTIAARSGEKDVGP